MKINIQAIGMDITDSIKKYTEDKINDLPTYFENIIGVDAHVGVLSQHHNKGKIFFAEFILQVPGKNITVKKEAEDLYKAIDKVKDHLRVELEKLKGKMRDIDKQELRDVKGYQE